MNNINLAGKTREELEELQTAIEVALARMTDVAIIEGRRDWAVRELERLAALGGNLTPDDMPADGFLPGQVVDVDDVLYRNTSGGRVTFPPGAETIDPWEEIEEGPTPDPEPEPEPEPPAPDYDDVPEWEQRHAHNAYAEGDLVRWDGGIYRSRHDNNAHRPDIAPDSWERVDE